MKNPFVTAKTGFDSLIAKGHTITGTLSLEPETTTVFDGTMTGDAIEVANGATLPSTTIVINGKVRALKKVDVPNVTITGIVECDVLESSGVLAIKAGARVTAKIIRYKTLVVETGAIINGTLDNLGEVPPEEKTT